MSGITTTMLDVDGKGRIHVPLFIRQTLGIEEQVIVEVEKGLLIVRPVKKIDDPVAFLSSCNIKTKKTPVEMKREAETAISTDHAFDQIQGLKRINFEGGKT